MDKETKEQWVIVVWEQHLITHLGAEVMSSKSYSVPYLNLAFFIHFVSFPNLIFARASWLL